ncbi:hypothetical protein QBZ16_000979 [Prototheca wickerhamii]|uniref:Uncharacterized protein n=1 Tax=Prototheca wickerhamii TaxID=3111 RepID=A0AAD9MGB2_PROWI|nr:hypothetical protein QBZ16_000979 [Prototheca wickerhamii]
MSILSFMPFLNPLAWVFASMDDEDNASLYRAYAILYTVPYLTDGFKLDSFVLLSIAAGVAHVQIERLAMTEPVEVDVLRLVRWAGRHALVVCGGTLRAAAELATEAARRARRAEELEPRDRDDWQ